MEASVCFEPANFNDNGLQIISEADKTSLYVLHIHTASINKVYAVAKKDDAQIKSTMPHTLASIFEKLKAGDFMIGSTTINEPTIINHIYCWEAEANDEIRLHYTPHSDDDDFSNNVAWRSITWDLFGELI